MPRLKMRLMLINCEGIGFLMTHQKCIWTFSLKYPAHLLIAIFILRYKSN